MVKQFLKQTSPVRHWFWVYLFCNLTLEFIGGTNPNARITVLYSLVEDGSTNINRYYKTTYDYVTPPDGNYYSNKAPGAIFAAYPFYKIADLFLTRNANSLEERDLIRDKKKFHISKFLMLIIQVIPFGLVVLYLASWLMTQGVDVRSVNWVCLMLLFGNTAAIYMNTNFGHGFAATMALLLLVCLLNRSFVGVGFFYGMTLLSDYMAAMLFLPCAAAAYVLLRSAPRPQIIKHVAYIGVGALVPATLWIWYHQVSFGGPFTLPLAFPCPTTEVSVGSSGSGVARLMNFMPNFSIIWALLFGSVRGILWTQPWVLVVLGAGIWYWRSISKSKKWREFPLLLVVIVAIPSLFLMLYLNASFTGWYAGLSAGPRYLSAVLPMFAIVAAFVMRDFPRSRLLFQLTTLFAMLFYVVVMSTSILPDYFAPIWPYYIDRIYTERTGTQLARIALTLAAMGIGFYVMHRRVGSARRPAR